MTTLGQHLGGYLQKVSDEFKTNITSVEVEWLNVSTVGKGQFRIEKIKFESEQFENFEDEGAT